jgi:hypothetical protein
MALETLSGVDSIGGFSVVIMDELRKKFPKKFNESGSMSWEWFESDIRPTNFVFVRQDKNSLAFTLQKGPIKEVGVNGCQIDTVIEAARLILEGLNKNFPCRENNRAIIFLDEALRCLKDRTKRRVQEGIEGKNIES